MQRRKRKCKKFAPPDLGSHKLNKGYTLKNQKLLMVVSKFGPKESHMLVIDGHRYSMNHKYGDMKYWNCSRQCGKRHKGKKKRFRGEKDGQRGERCRARVRTMIQPNGLYSVTISQPEHIHLPPNHINGEYEYILGRDPNEHNRQ